jgi:hypothetical protein
MLLPRLLLEELVTHGVEGDGQPAPEEQDEVDGQLVPGTTTKKLFFTDGQQKSIFTTVLRIRDVYPGSRHNSLTRYG